MNPDHVRCERCRLKRPYCLCPWIPRVETHARFLVVRHALESSRRSNSAHVAALAMPGCEIVEYGRRGEEFADPRLERPGTWLLYPGAPPMPTGTTPPALVVVLDGSWRQARRMFLRVAALQRLPRLSLPAPSAPPPHRLRRAGPSHAMATLEAIAHAVEHLEGAEAARPLHELFARFVEHGIRNSEGARRWRTAGR